MNNPVAFTAGCHSEIYQQSDMYIRMERIQRYNSYYTLYAIIHAARYTQAHPVMSAHLPNHEQSKQWD